MNTIYEGDHRFFVGDNEENPLAEITFKDMPDNKLLVDKTHVSDELRGQGIAGKLVDRMVQHARSEGKMIVPECSYAKSKIESTPQYHDVLAE